MNKLFTKIAALALGAAMVVGVGVSVSGQVKASETKAGTEVEVYKLDGTTTGTGSGYADDNSTTQDSVEWIVNGNITMNPWRIGGKNLSNVHRYVKSNASVSTENITKVELEVGAASSITVNGLTLLVGKSAGASTVGSVAGTFAANSTITFNRPTGQDWSSCYFTFDFNVSVSGNSNRFVQFKSATFYAEQASTKTVTELITDPEDGGEIPLNASGSSSISSTIEYIVGYDDESTGYDVEISCAPSSGVAIVDDEAGTATLTFSANDTFVVTVTADSNHTASITYIVQGVPVVEYEFYTSTLVESDYVILSHDSAFTYALGDTIVSSRVANASVTPTVTSNKIQNPASGIVYHIAKESAQSNYWVIINKESGKYLAGTSTKNQAAFVDSVTDLARWTISYEDSKWVFHNYGRSIASSDSANAYLRNNTNSGWAAYSSTQGNAPALFKLKTNDPYITVDVTVGSTDLGIDETATVVATKENGATGTITFTAGSGKISVGTPSVSGDTSTVVVTGVSTGTVDLTVGLTGGSTVTPVVISFTVRNGTASSPYSVAEARAAIDANVGITNVYTSGTIAQIDSYNESYHSITYWISDDGTTTDMLEVYGGKGLNNADFNSVSDIVVGAEVTVYGTLKKYSSTYEYDANSYLTAYSAPGYTLTAITGIDGTLSANSGDLAWNLSGLTAKGSFSNGQTNQNISAYVTLSTNDVPGTVSETTQKTVSVTVTPLDQSLSSLTTSINVSGTINYVTGPLTNNGRYYIMNSDKTVGLKAEAASSSPTGVDLTASNQMTAFDVKLTANNTYEITTTISNVKYYLVCNTTATSSANTSIRIISSNFASGLASKSWLLDNSSVETAGSYHVGENTTGSTYRYLSYYEDNNDWRGYLNTNNGDPEIQFVEEGSYAANIATKLKDDLTCNQGATAPSTSVWGAISDAYGEITIQYEQNLLKNATYTKSGSGTSTVVEATGTTTQATAEAIAKYDYVVGKYLKGQGLEAYNDFLGRDPETIGSGRIVLDPFGISEGNPTAIIIIVSVIGVSALGGFFFLRKRKEI